VESDRIGIMGGTYDPIHNGHLAVAEAARRHFGLGRIIFIPAGITAHKNNRLITPSVHRFEMTSLAVSSNKYFDVTDIEIKRSGASYTADTILELKHMLGKGAKLYFITGADTMTEMFMWKTPEVIFKNCNVITVFRPGSDDETLYRHVSDSRDKYGAKIHVLRMPALEISSSSIRKRIEIERPVRYLLPEIVEEYISQHRLYRNDSYDMEFAEQAISSALSGKRWRHTMGVVDEAVRLAEIYGLSRRKAYVAAVVHDYAKEMPVGEKLHRCKEWGIPLDDIMHLQVDLAHGFLSAEKAKMEFKIDDQEILKAISFHTTGCEQMSLLDKILIVADCIEPNRTVNISAVREAALTNLNKAVILALEMKIAFAVSKKQLIHPLSNKAIRHLKKIN